MSDVEYLWKKATSVKTLDTYSSIWQKTTTNYIICYLRIIDYMIMSKASPSFLRYFILNLLYTIITIQYRFIVYTTLNPFAFNRQQIYHKGENIDFYLLSYSHFSSSGYPFTLPSAFLYINKSILDESFRF